MESDISKKISPPMIGEAIFDILYLLFVITSGIVMLAKSGSTTLTLFGIMALVLGIGDAFHLIPRIYANLTDKMELCKKALGFGKIITSVSMTFMYIILYFAGAAIYGERWVNTPVLVILLLLATIRVILCLLPQNGWFSRKPPVRWATYRNLPFTAIGIIMIVLFASMSPYVEGFRFMPLAIGLSFAFYLPVTVLSGKYPKTGMLMIPKTLAYVWIVCMGFSLM